MSDLDDFLAQVVERQEAAETALHNGDPEPRLAMWSTHDPITLFGAAVTLSGAGEVRAFFRGLAARFSNCTSFRFEVQAAGASGDVAYTVGLEHTSVSINGHPTSYVLRVTHTYRREDGEWRIVHRHGDTPPPEHQPLEEAVKQ
jgi:ketosteroid isomerase-like protein